MTNTPWHRFKFWLSLLRVSFARKMHHKPSSVLLVIASTYIETYGTVDQRFRRYPHEWNFPNESGAVVPKSFYQEFHNFTPYEETHDC